MDEDLKKLIEETSAETHRRFDEAVVVLRQVNVETRQHFGEAVAELRQENVETRQHFDVVVAELRQENVETRQHFDVVASDMRRHFDVTAEDFRHQVQLVAEGVDNVINERFVQLTSGLMNELAESKAIMRFSYSDLDRRLRSLEERVERLESSSARPQ
jgi:Zn-finger domain-containing protein